MEHTNVDPDLAEALCIERHDAYALSGDWKYNYLEEPTADLNSFFTHLPGKRMLDVGCGWSRYVNRFLDQGLEYVGIDNSPEMIKLSRKEHPDEMFKLMSYRKLEFPDGSFDGLWCCCTFSNEPKHNMPTVLTELKRILKFGGIMTVVMPAISDSHEELAVDASGAPMLHHAFYEQRELTMLLEMTGFSVIDTTWHYNQSAMSVLVKKT